MPTTLRSFCKINLGLAVGPVREDGFHGLATCYQTLALHDLVTVSARPGARTILHIEADHAGVPQTATGDAERNTVWRMVSGALERMGVTAEVAVRIQKRLPVQGGLGAGSANAAAALLGLERELGCTLDGEARLALGAGVGSDVPLFLLGGTVLGRSRGEEVYPLPDLPELPCVVAVPEVGVSTARAFRTLDERMGNPPAVGGEALTNTAAFDRLMKLSRALAAVWTTSGAESEATAGQPADTSEPSFTGIAKTLESELASGPPPTRDDLPRGKRGSGDLAEKALLALVRTGMENDFEEVVFSEHPLLRSTKRDLMGSGPGSWDPVQGGALYAALSGSGSALFGLYRTRADAEAAQQRVEVSGTRALVTTTIARRRYWQAIFAGARTGFAE